jgi:predicted DCC family thiol-disulfide oxidoreductase YuxK
MPPEPFQTPTKPADNPAAPGEKLELVYDGQCPVCRTYCENLKPDAEAFCLIDARKGGALMEEITSRGLDIDQGMVLKAGDKLYYGSEAIHQISLRARKKGLMAWVNRWFFITSRRAAIFYPAGRAVRNALLRLLGIGDIHNLKPGNTLKHQLGEAWQNLDPNIQARFDREPGKGETIVYAGIMEEIRCSFMGRLFAQLTRVVGNPLSPFAGRDVPMEVRLSPHPSGSGTNWQRTYFYPGRKPYTVTSTKRENKAGEMLECVGGGFGMKLKVTVENREMHFRSYRYFWIVLKFAIPLPHWITPGQTHVVHADLGGGKFMYEISMKHDMLGETFYQRGIFSLKP